MEGAGEIPAGAKERDMMKKVVFSTVFRLYEQGTQGKRVACPT
jgi:hypothetical protein